jgi:ABC-2 type transport system permease protein
VFACGSIASALAWLTVSAEDAPELLASSPVATGTLVRAKIEAALLPIAPLLLLPIVFVARSHPLFAASLCVCAVGASVSCAVLQIRNPTARKRADFRSRHKGRGLSGLIEITVIALWVGLCAAVTALG